MLTLAGTVLMRELKLPAAFQQASQALVFDSD